MDSTYVAWKMLNDRMTNVYIHHVLLKNDREKMWKEQYVAVLNIIRYFKECGFTFDYSESAYVFINHSVIGFDSDVLLLSAQKVAQNFRRKSVRVYTGWKAPYDGMGVRQRESVQDRIRRKVSENLWSALVDGATNRNYIDKELHFPLMNPDITKADMLKEMPQELIDLTWSCRTPNKGKACGRCHACIEIDIAKK